MLSFEMPGIVPGISKDSFMADQALFEGLIYDELGRPVTVAYVGTDAHYVVDDDGFHRHVLAETVDRQVLEMFVEQLQANKELAVAQALQMLGQDDLFTKAALDHSIENVSPEQIIQQGIPPQARDMMGMMGFRVVIDVHGELVSVEQPGAPEE
jgi:hypothetical protein